MASPSSRQRSWVRSAIPLRVGRANAPFSNTSVVFATNERGGSPRLILGIRPRGICRGIDDASGDFAALTPR